MQVWMFMVLHDRENRTIWESQRYLKCDNNTATCLYLESVYLQKVEQSIYYNDTLHFVCATAWNKLHDDILFFDQVHSIRHTMTCLARKTSLR